MFRMMAHIGQTASVTCWTCHRGSVKGPLLPESGRPSEKWPEGTVALTLTSEQEKLPAKDLFKNIQSMAMAPAGRLAFAMNFFSASLGVRCDHCHVPGQWEKDDKPAKATARRMLAMVQSTLKEFYGGAGPVGCYTCHRGAVKPETNPR